MSRQLRDAEDNLPIREYLVGLRKQQYRFDESRINPSRRGATGADIAAVLPILFPGAERLHVGGAGRVVGAGDDDGLIGLGRVFLPDGRLVREVYTKRPLRNEWKMTGVAVFRESDYQYSVAEVNEILAKIDRLLRQIASARVGNS